MKTPVSFIWIPGLVLIMAWLPSGLAQIETNLFAPLKRDANPVVVPGPSTPAPVFPEITAPSDPPSLATPSSKSDVQVSERQPPRIRLSPWTSEIVKLAESGIEVGVILSFIENSGTFNLGADQIVYLNDLGLSSELISAMLRHDQEIVSGARPLTIVSEPAWDSAFDLTSASRKASSRPAVATSLVAAPSSSVRTPNQESSLEMNPTPPTTKLVTMPNIAPDELVPVQTTLFSELRQPTEKKNSLYRVREPYPEEVTAPIILIYGEGRPANTVVVVGFPRTTP